MEELLELVKTKQYTVLRQELSELNEPDIAAFLQELEEDEMLKIFRILPKSLAADVFSYLDLEEEQMIITSLSDREAANIVNNLMADDATDLLEEMPASIVKRILANANSETRRDINHLLRYPEESAGSIMTVEFVDLKENITVADAIHKIRNVGLDSETINICYVLDVKRKLLGTVALTAMPVVDNEDRLVGIITVDDVVDIMQEETTEDMEKMAAIVPSDKSYMRTGVFETYKKRIPWLLLLMISATFTGGIIASFEDALSLCSILTVYIPMLMDTGGNAGGQASVTIIRGLSLNEIEFRDAFRVVWKESRVAFLCGVTLAAANFVKLMLLDRVSLTVALVVCVTLVISVLVAKIVGCMFPMLAKKIGFDPAVMASPFITTIVDAISLIIYFMIATQMLDLI